MTDKQRCQRDIILARRGRFLGLALAGASLGAASEACVCLDMPPPRDSSPAAVTVDPTPPPLPAQAVGGDPKRTEPDADAGSPPPSMPDAATPVEKVPMICLDFDP